MVSDPVLNPFVILVHGIRACKEDINPMIPGAMLFRNKFNVLLIDLRNCGQSQTGKYPYETFGDQENYDVLGALDYLLKTFPSLQNTTNRIGLFGVSMGGATVTIAFARDTYPYMRALWLDAPALDVYGTLAYNVAAVGYNPGYVMDAVCSLSRLKWPFGCPPFKYDPLQYAPLIGKTNITRHVFFVSKLEDKIVPIFNDNEGEKVMSAAGVNVTKWYTSDPNAPSSCDHHIDSVFYDPAGYESRLVSFFNDHLVRY